MSRKRQAEAAGVGAAGSRLAQRAYRDAYLSVELSNVSPWNVRHVCGYGMRQHLRTWKIRSPGSVGDKFVNLRCLVV